MDAKELVDAIRIDLAARGFTMTMSKGRDAIARLIYGRPLSLVIAAMRAGTLDQPAINDIGVADIKMRYGEAHANLAVEVATFFLLTSYNQK